MQRGGLENAIFPNGSERGEGEEGWREEGKKKERKKGKSGRAGDIEGRGDRESVEGGIMNAGIIAVVT